MSHALLADGWSEMEDTGFIAFVGPFFYRGTGDTLEIAMPTDDRHRNRSGIVQGGLICTLADRSLGMASRETTRNRPQVTIKLDMTFLDRIEVGDLVIARPKIVRTSRTLNFGAVEISVGERLVASATGIFKLL